MEKSETASAKRPIAKNSNTQTKITGSTAFSTKDRIKSPIQKSTNVPKKLNTVFTRSALINSDNVEQAMFALKPSVPKLGGMQSPGLGAFTPKVTMPRFKPVKNGEKFVQVIQLPNHWICASNVHATTDNEVFVYDSMTSGTLPDSTIVQLTSLLRASEESDYIVVRIRNCAQQPMFTLACGYYAIAAAVAICQGNEPTLWRYNHKELIDFITNGYKGTKFEMLKPETIVDEKFDINVFTESKRHCLCQQRSTGSMIQCSECLSWYHMSCVTATRKQRKRDSSQWYGPCCDHVVKFKKKR